MEGIFRDMNHRGTEAAVLMPDERDFHLHGYCYRERPALLADLDLALTNCGGWILERQTLSAATIAYRFEIQLAGVDELYAAIVEMGLELMRTTHNLLTDLCTCRQHATRSIDPFKIMTIRLEVSFLADVTLHSLLMTGGNRA